MWLLIGLVGCVCDGLLGVSFMSLALCFAFVSCCFDLLGVCGCCLLERVVGSSRFGGFGLVIVWFVMVWDDLGCFTDVNSCTLPGVVCLRLLFCVFVASFWCDWW